METKETPKTTNPYTRPAPIKYFKCNQPGHRSSDYPLRKIVHLVEGKKKKLFVSQMEMEKKKKIMRKVMRDTTTW